MHKFAECGLQPTPSHLVAQVHLYQYLLDTVQWLGAGQNKDMIVIE